MDPEFLKDQTYLEALVRKILPLDHQSLLSLLRVISSSTQLIQNIPSFSFRIALCEMMAQQLSPESVKAINSFNLEEFPAKVLRAYIPSLPSGRRDGANDLVKYCIVVGFLFRGWVFSTKAKERYPGLTGIVNEAIRKRKNRLESLKDGERQDIENVISLEAMMMKTLAIKVEKETGVLSI